MNRDKVSQRMSELIEPIHKQIMMCDNTDDLLMLASCMMVKSKEIFDQQLGLAGRKKMFEDFNK